METPHSDLPIATRETAASPLVRQVPTGSPDETVTSVLARLPGNNFDYADTIYVIDRTNTLIGMVPLPRLLAAAPHHCLRDILRRPFPTAYAETDQETVASRAIVNGLAAVPVVDEQQRLLGVVPPQALLEILRHEHIEDLNRFTGIRHYNLQARTAMESSPIRRARDRLPWLLVGLMGSMLATYVMTRFEHALQSQVMIAFFVPGLVYLADAVGTQTEAIAVRGLSLSDAPVGTMIAGELRTGLIIGLTLGALTFPVVWLIFGDVRLALAVSLALLAAGSVATSIGFLFPWTFFRLGKDPAFGSGPLATIFQNVLTLVVYYFTVSLIVL
ncbi:magnesium transporter [Nitrosospira sp. Is2]|uniref:magnesium transporter n=1 Tax=Nitrosospira sp. Is2 TaxID=3080532 RepID=UPI002952D3C4|nr:magnesium transporter [Nitrosospira sp. Is2]WON72448.1 magnesium transporter [Nitrosospira sp. Is2]